MILDRLTYYIRHYFGFSRRETHTTLLLLWLLVPALLYVPYRRHCEEQRIHALLEEEGGTYHAQLTTLGRTFLRHRQLNINTATVAMLQARGLHPTVATRIVAHRTRLGGFVSTAQYKEVQGLHPKVLLLLAKCTYIDERFLPEKLQLNHATAQTLARHPYLTYQQAQLLVRYREQHGPYKEVEALHQVALLSQAHIARLAPYLAF